MTQPTRTVRHAVEPAIAVDGLVCQHGGRVTLDVPQWRVLPGERVAVIGHNGAGKSTLMRVLGGVALPHHGSATVLGHTLDGDPVHAAAARALRAQVGHVMQGVHLVQRLSARENVLIGALGRLSGWRTWARWHHPRDVADAERALADVMLGAKAHQRADRLSGGERQKVAIARMLMQRPRLILADEPTASLDPLAASEICQLLCRAARGATLITVVHNPALLPLIADRVVGLKQGRIAFDVPVDAVDDRRLTALYRADGAAEPRPAPQTSVPWRLPS